MVFYFRLIKTLLGFSVYRQINNLKQCLLIFFLQINMSVKTTMGTSSSWAQNVITCDLCDKPTQQFSNSCQVSLCETCIKKHRDEFKSLIYEIVPFLEKKIQFVFPECREHSGQRCEVNCKKCNRPVCVKCIVSGPH